jgi:hypothetical protein
MKLASTLLKLVAAAGVLGMWVCNPALAGKNNTPSAFPPRVSIPVQGQLWWRLDGYSRRQIESAKKAEHLYTQSFVFSGNKKDVKTGSFKFKPYHVNITTHGDGFVSVNPERYDKAPDDDNRLILIVVSYQDATGKTVFTSVQIIAPWEMVRVLPCAPVENSRCERFYGSGLPTVQEAAEHRLQNFQTNQWDPTGNSSFQPTSAKLTFYLLTRTGTNQ